MADLAHCLDYRADQASESAKEAFEEISGQVEGIGTVMAPGEAALRSAIRALARRDDRGNWARRFASIEAMDEFMAVDPATASVAIEKRRSGLVAALGVLITEGYISRDNAGNFDISHEALIRNWRTAGSWLRDASDTALAIERVLQDVDPSLIGVDDKADEIEELIPRQVAERLGPIAGPASQRESPSKTSGTIGHMVRWVRKQIPFPVGTNAATENTGVVGLPTRWSKEQIRLLIGTHDGRQGWGSEDQALLKIQTAREQANNERIRRANQEKWGTRIKVGLPILFLGLVGFIIVLSNAYLSARQASLAALGTAVISYASSQQSSSYDNGTRAYDMKTVGKVLHPLVAGLEQDENTIKLARGVWDFGARYVLEASLTLSDSNTEKVNTRAICWAKDKGPGENHIKLGTEQTLAKLILLNGTHASIVRDEPDTTGEDLATWDVEQLSAYQDIDTLPPHTRLCIAEDGSTLIVAIPGSRLQAFSLLLKTIGHGKFQMRGWPINDRSGPAAQLGTLACVRGINEARNGTAVTTKILYDLIPTEADCESVKKEQQVAEFVRGLFTPVELPTENDGASKPIKCNKSGRKKSVDNDLLEWICKNSKGAIISVDITVPNTGKNPPFFTVIDPAHEISGGTISIDEAVLPKSRDADDIFPESVSIGCYDKSISVLITAEKRTWAYVVGTDGLERFLTEVASKHPQLQSTDPINVLNEKPDDSYLTFPARMVRNAQSLFQGDPPPLCP